LRHQALHNFGRHDQPCDRRDESVAGRHLPGARRVRVRGRARRRLLAGLYGRLLGIDDFQRGDAPLAQFASHYPRHRADGRVVDIRDFEGRRVKLVGSAHGADDGHAQRGRPAGELELRRHRVHRVHNVVVRRQVYLASHFREIEQLTRSDSRLWVYFQKALSHHGDLVAADRPVRRYYLAVDVGDVDDVSVEQVYRADPAAAERLGAVPAHAADSENRHAVVL